MAKQLQFNARARYSLKQGVDTLANAVKVTIGPRGRNVVIDKRFETPNILNDGVAIARDIDLEEPFANMGVQLVKEVAIKTNDMAGDGTTTATILVQAILVEGLKNIVAGANPMLLRDALERGTEALVAEIKAMSKPIETHEEIAQVATIAANDPEIGEMIAEVLDHVGRDGVVTVEEGQGLKSEVEYIKGMQFDRGYIAPFMASDQDRLQTVLSNTAILITDKKITNSAELLPLLEHMLAQGKNELVVIAEDIEGEALTTLAVNKTRGIFHVLGIRAPSFGDRREAMLDDIAIMTGGKVISEVTGSRLVNATIGDLGTARSVATTKNSTLIIDGGGSKETIRVRMHELRTQLANGVSDFDRDKLQARLANLSGGVGVIKVGAATEVEMKEKKLRVQDAVSATQAALEEGVVPGGGAALLIALPALDCIKTKTLEEKIGLTILRRALEEPLRQIAANAGYEASVVVANVREKPFGYGFDAMDGQYVDMFKAGIIDPVLVTRTALQNAVSIAALLLTTDTLITDAPVHIPDFKDKGCRGA
ncbi:MAG TPA: chaperonin GroEL [Ktedonobacter sp.]|nr:chaperonin GroEL [Ktedonobacter sp.]